MSHEIPDGTTRTVWRVSLPLIIAFLSGLGMISVDRFFLARYSPEALAAAASAGTAAWAITFGGQTLTGVTTIFVARHNGAGHFTKIGEAVWQMLWMSLLLILPCLAIGLWLGPAAFKGSAIEESQILYYRWMIGISPLFFLQGALNGFFIGRGHTAIITQLSLLGNLINLLLDPILIFGWGSIPSYGMAGACIATAVGVLAQITVMFYIFMSPANRKQFHTMHYPLRWQILWDGIRIGAPEAISIILELSAWGFFYSLMSDLSATHILVASVGQSLLLMFIWFGLGLEQGAASVSGNLLGAGKVSEVSKVLHSGFKINLYFALGLFAFLWAADDLLIGAFLNSPETLEGAEKLTTLGYDEIERARTHLKVGIYVVGLYVVVENIRCVLYGILRSAGDTLFILWLSLFAIWTLLLAPTYLLMSRWQMPVITLFGIWITYASLSTVICYGRYILGTWQRRPLIQITQH